MKNLIALVVFATATATTTTTAFAQPAPAPAEPADPEIPTTVVVAPPATPAAQPARTATAEPAKPHEGVADSSGWHKPVGRRLLHGFRIGYNHIAKYDQPTRENGMSIQEEFKLKTPHTMVLGYETFYRIVGHSWLNVLVVGNVSVAGLEQSKFIPTASGLIGAEFNESFQVGVGVNLTPDPQAPTHMIAAVGWTPRVGAIYTPVHFFFVPDTEGNHRAGATVGVTW